MSFLAHLEWRHAVKAFDPNRRVSAENLQKILHATRMAPTSYGLQPFAVEVIEDSALQERLAPAAYHQKQISTASALLVFVARTDIKARIDGYLDGLSGGNADARAGLKGFEAAMRGSLEQMTPEIAKSWSAKQAYIALGFALAACAELEVDSCPMEGFNSPDFDRLLELGPQKYSAALLTIGYRDRSVPTKDKYRFPESDLFTRHPRRTP